MAEPTSFIRLDRSIRSWRWYRDGNTLRVFLHLLLAANYEDRDFREDRIRRGEVLISQSRLSEELGISPKSIRTALDHLIGTGEIEIAAPGVNGQKATIYRVVNYALYQDAAAYGRRRGTPEADAGQEADSPPAEPGQDSGSSPRNEIPKENKNTTEETEKSEKNPLFAPPLPRVTHETDADGTDVFAPPTLCEVARYIHDEGLDVSSNRFFSHYSGMGWRINGQPIRNWQAIADKWDEENRRKRLPDGL